MKILVDARFYGLENAGLGRYTIGLIDGLRQVDNNNEYFILLRKSYFNKLKLPKNWTQIKADFRPYSLLEQAFIPGIIRKIKPDLTHFLHFNVPLLFREKFVATVHDIVMHKQTGLNTTTLPFFLYYPKRFAYLLTFKRVLKQAEKVIIPSQTVKKELMHLFKTPENKLIPIYEGVSDSFSVNTFGSGVLNKYEVEKPYFLYVGNAYPHKNLENTIRGVVFLNNRLPKPVQLVIVTARNVFLKRLAKLTKKLHAEKFVKIIGFVEDNDLASLYKNSLAFVYPSLTEGFGLPGLEAMSSGTLVLASNIEVFKEVYKDNATYFNPNDYQSISREMKKVVKMGEKERKSKIDSGREFVKRYSWSKMAKETLQVYRSVC